MGRTVRANRVHQTVPIELPDQFALSLTSSMALATLPASPMSAGVHSPGASAIGHMGLAGYGVGSNNRFEGRTDPHQEFGPVANPVLDPINRRVGIGAGVAGQPGLPNTGTSGDSAVAWLSLFQTGNLGFGQ